MSTLNLKNCTFANFLYRKRDNSSLFVQRPTSIRLSLSALKYSFLFNGLEGIYYYSSQAIGNSMTNVDLSVALFWHTNCTVAMPCKVLAIRDILRLWANVNKKLISERVNEMEKRTDGVIE